MSRNSSGVIQVTAIVLGLFSIISFLFLFSFFIVEALTTENNTYNDFKLALILIGAIASVLTWVASLVLYGFSEMLASVKNIEANINNRTNPKTLNKN